jgi:hypothetical protein
MFRVPEDTVLRRLAATSLLVIASTLAACGGSDAPDTASTEGSTPAATSAPVAVPVTTPPTTPEDKKAAKKAAKEAEQAAKAAAKQAESDATAHNAAEAQANVPKVSETPETDATVADADTKSYTKADIKSQYNQANAALSKAGEVTTKAESPAPAMATIQDVNTTIVFYKSAHSAAKNAKAFQLVIAANPTYGRIARKDNRLYLLATPKAITDDDTAAFKKVQEIVNGTL